MRLEHPDARPEGVIEPVTARLNPEQHPDDGEIEKENDVRHLARGKRDRDNGGTASDSPIGGHIEPLPPDHDAAHLAPIKTRPPLPLNPIAKAPVPTNPCLFPPATLSL